MYGSKISMIRLARGYTQDYIAKQLGMAQNVYSKIEKNERITIDYDLLEKIASILGVSIEDIKSPTPIVMSFKNSQSDTIVNTQNNYDNNKLIEELTQQLRLKDERIDRLISIIEKSA